MSISAKELTTQVLSRSTEERVILAQRVWDSVEHFVDSETEKAWLDESEQRWKEIEKGKVKCVPAGATKGY